MLLRLRQGIGRLIRSHDDSGIVTIFMPLREKKVVEKVLGVLPTDVEYL